MTSFADESNSTVYGTSADQLRFAEVSDECPVTYTSDLLFKNGDPRYGDKKKKNKKKKKNQVFLEGYVEADNDQHDELSRAKSLTDEDLDELKGCLDLGFGFSYEEIPELCNTLPALELCYSMNQKFLDDQQKFSDVLPDSAPSVSSSFANWKISSPGDNPDDVKARLKYWAQAVACTVKLCN